MRQRPKYVKWAREDLKKLERLYPVTSNAELMLEFAPRSLSSILSMASALTLKRRSPRDWKAIAASYLGARKAGVVE